MKRVSFKVAKAIKEAGCPQEWYDCEYYYTETGELKRCDDYEGNSVEDITYNQRYAIPAPYYLEAWLWLWREKKCYIQPELCFRSSNESSFVCIDKINHIALVESSLEDPEEAIIAAIDYLVNNDLIK